MSLVYITEHNETIYDVDKAVEEKRRTKQYGYISQYKKAIFEELNKPDIIIDADGVLVYTDSKRHKHKSMGPPKLTIPKACEYKHPRPIRWRRTKDHVCPVPACRAPPVPRFNREDIVEIEREKKDYIQINIDKIPLLKRKVQLPMVSKTITGSTYMLVGAGVLPENVCSKRFGKVPKYLKKIRQDIIDHPICKKETETKQERERGIMRKGVYIGRRALTLEERIDILRGLRDRYKETLRVYMTSSVYTDTTSKKKRIGDLERELTTLENDLALFESTKCLYVEID
ncbi:uncharacterized protein LOC119682307 [Teleopsis dalmanni]|uniref:uncharacterized protein LOC119682199 n=1 Tax=Teleopsis dalmanni TaxID=139649 RepID=UPI0018CFBFA7|nr:uncharacterized protein LOC119682199 [Teleopsis dalmanni]XP_037951643.1 uncharacterized protein LOC119682307 [Teleopsis dalmanni]